MRKIFSHIRGLHWLTAVVGLALAAQLLFSACQRVPLLHLCDHDDIVIDIPMVQLDLDVFWNYDIDYDWEANWTYGWDDYDLDLYGEIGYTEPTVFDLRRYYLGKQPSVPHTRVDAHEIAGRSFKSSFSFGYYDLLVWNKIFTSDGVQSLVFDEESSLDSVMAFTNMGMTPTRYKSHRVGETRAVYHQPGSAEQLFTRAFYQPEELFSAGRPDLYISDNVADYDYYDEETHTYYKYADMTLHPVTYIYLTQVRIHNNRGRVTGVDGEANISGMARGVTLNSGLASRDAITVHYNTRFKFDKVISQTGEHVDVAGGRCLTFGIPNQNSSRVTRASDVKDGVKHYMDINLIFNNGLDSTFVFDVTDSVRKYYKGGVITIDINLDTIPIPSRKGGSGFDAVVKDFDEETYEFDM